MKLRIYRNSIRIRVSRTEVDSLAYGQALEERLSLGPGESQHLDYRVVPVPLSTPGTEMRADLDKNTLTLKIRLEALQQWRDSSRLEIEGRQEWAGGSLGILLEKDMRRLNPKEDEDTSDLYGNPLFGRARCDHP